MMRYLDEYLEVVAAEILEDYIYDLPSLYKFITDRMNVFLEANPLKYRKPAGFHLVFYQPSCCPHHICIGSSKERIKIFTKTQ